MQGSWEWPGHVSRWGLGDWGSTVASSGREHAGGWSARRKAGGEHDLASASAVPFVPLVVGAGIPRGAEGVGLAPLCPSPQRLLSAAPLLPSPPSRLGWRRTSRFSAGPPFSCSWR